MYLPPGVSVSIFGSMGGHFIFVTTGGSLPDCLRGIMKQSGFFGEYIILLSCYMTTVSDMVLSLWQ